MEPLRPHAPLGVPPAAPHAPPAPGNVVFVGVRWGFKARQIFRITLGPGSEGVLERLVKEVQDYTGEPIQTVRVSSDYQEVARAIGVEERKDGARPPVARKTPPRAARRAAAPQ